MSFEEEETIYIYFLLHHSVLQHRDAALVSTSPPTSNAVSMSARQEGSLWVVL